MGIKVKPEIRYLNNMEMVLYDQKWGKNAQNFAVYYMYRGIKEKNSLRYDITDITNEMLGKEFPKTMGHEHPSGCCELITILQGKAIFLFQKCKGKEVIDVYQIRAKKGESVIVPPGYSNITINIGKTNLKIANWINKKCIGIYDFIKRMEGTCYYYTKSGWIKNKNYKKIPKIHFEKPLEEMPKSLDFLK